MLWLSEVLLQHPEVETFEDLRLVIANKGAAGERFFRMDIKPPFVDTPPDWEDRLEAAFTSIR